MLVLIDLDGDMTLAPGSRDFGLTCAAGEADRARSSASHKRSHHATMPLTQNLETLGGAVERAFYFWTGLILAGFSGFFAVWTFDTYDSDLSHTRLFWFSVGGTVVGVMLLFVAAIATAVVIATREHGAAGGVAGTDA